MINFGYRKGKGRLSFKAILDFKEYFKTLTETRVGLVFIIGALLGFLISRVINYLQEPSGIVMLITIFGIGIWMSYPFYLIMRISGDKSVGRVLGLYALSWIISLVAQTIFASNTVLVIAPVLGFVLGVGLIYPKKFTLVDAILTYFVISVIGFLIMIITGAVIFGSIILGEPAAQSIISTI